MKNEFTLSETFNASAETLYKAWLSTDGHTLMTGSPAKVDGREGGAFTAWDGYIWGIFLKLEPHKRITQSWRTSEFPGEADESHVELVFEQVGNETKLTLVHTEIPEEQDGYKQGWLDFYFKPMKEYFG